MRPTNLQINRTIARALESIPAGKGFTSRLVQSFRNTDYLWDPWILADGNLYRLFYLATPKPHPSVPFWSQGSICGAISRDMQTWEYLGVMLEPHAATSWEAGRMLAGCTYQEDGIYYLFYSASGRNDLLGAEQIGLATSKDGLTWHRYSQNPFFSDNDRCQWYGMTDFNHFHWRDPYIVKDTVSGRYYMFICTYLNQVVPIRYCACIGLAVSNVITGPYTLLPPVTLCNIHTSNDRIFDEMERPQIIYRNGKYHLFFSCWKYNLNPVWLSTVEQQRISHSSVYHFIADTIEGPYQPISRLPVVKGSESTGMYGTNFFPDPTRPGEFVACGWYHNLHSLEISPLFKVYWQGDLIEIRRG